MEMTADQTVVHRQERTTDSRGNYAGKNNQGNCRILLRKRSRIGVYECKAKGVFRKEKIKL